MPHDQVEPAGPESGIFTDWAPDSDVLIIGFRGLNPDQNLRFHFLDVTKGLDANKLFLRDHHFVWYHHGIEGLTGTIDETAEFLATLIAERGINRIICIGVSGGAYAALLFGWLLEADEVHAISPQTHLDKASGVDSYEWGARFLNDLHTSERAQPEYFDLGALFPLNPEIRSRFNIHYCETDDGDREHALRLKGLPGVNLIPHREGAHRLALYMVRSGEVRSILESSVAGPA
jgi:pimeloyl-ACP methyl ester carboxylesterase